LHWPKRRWILRKLEVKTTDIFCWYEHSKTNSLALYKFHMQTPCSFAFLILHFLALSISHRNRKQSLGGWN
jgi:hypothetical protein